MTSERAEWETIPVAPPEHHPDPRPGGPPQVSADGHWWWDGETWVPVRPPSTAA